MMCAAGAGAGADAGAGAGAAGTDGTGAAAGPAGAGNRPPACSLDRSLPVVVLGCALTGTAWAGPVVPASFGSSAQARHSRKGAKLLPSHRSRRAHLTESGKLDEKAGPQICRHASLPVLAYCPFHQSPAFSALFSDLALC